MGRNKLYVLIAAACVAGYVWIAFTYHRNLNDTFQVCMFKHFTHIPCPSCGSTRSVLSILHGSYTEAFFWNPFGFIIVLFLFTVPCWLVFDLITHKTTLVKIYQATESLMRKGEIAIPAIILVLANWIWNIYKGL